MARSISSTGSRRGPEAPCDAWSSPEGTVPIARRPSRCFARSRSSSKRWTSTRAGRRERAQLTVRGCLKADLLHAERASASSRTAHRVSIARNTGACAVTLPVVPRGNTANSQTTKATLGLRELLLNGAFEPRERVPELRLVEQLGVSRTPLRTALMTLEHEGLLETLPGGGFVAREFTRSDIDDAIELRGGLEGPAARLAAERLESDEELEPLREHCRAMDEVVRDRSVDSFMDYVRVNQEFHDAFRDLAKSPQLDRALEHALALPFAPPSALLMVHAALPESWEILL